jgi:hypothetical protein
MSDVELPVDPPERAFHEREFIEARESHRIAHVGDGPSHLKEHERIREATAVVRELAREASPAPTRLFRGLEENDPSAIESALVFLEADPFGWHTGYLKQKIMCRLGRVPMSGAQKERLREVLIRLTVRGKRQEFRDACRLARHVDSSEFRLRLRGLAERPEPHISYAAGRMLKALETNRKVGWTE